jgi:uncharacterized surface protein with fasciclin (FAS1) repeats
MLVFACAALMAIAFFSSAAPQGPQGIDHAIQQGPEVDQNQEIPTVGQLVAESETLTRLADLVEKARLTDALSAEGPITVFAPSDTAIGRLNAVLYDDIVKPENRSQLSDGRTGFPRCSS